MSDSDSHRQTIRGHDGYGADRYMAVRLPREGDPDQVELIVQGGHIVLGRGALIQLMGVLGRAEWRVITGRYWRPSKPPFQQ